MAKKAVKTVVWEPVKIKHRTSIGRGSNSRPGNKHKRRSFKKYRGQG